MSDRTFIVTSDGVPLTPEEREEYFPTDPKKQALAEAAHEWAGGFPIVVKNGRYYCSPEHYTAYNEAGKIVVRSDRNES